MSPLLEVGVSCVSQFPVDCMHLVCLGPVQWLMLLWLKCRLKCRLHTYSVQKTHQQMSDIHAVCYVASVLLGHTAVANSSSLQNRGKYRMLSCGGSRSYSQYFAGKKFMSTYCWVMLEVPGERSHSNGMWQHALLNTEDHNVHTIDGKPHSTVRELSLLLFMVVGLVVMLCLQTTYHIPLHIFT